MHLGYILIGAVSGFVISIAVDVDFQTACQAVTSNQRAMYRGSCYIVQAQHIDGDSAASYCTHLDAKYRAPDGQPQLVVFTGQAGLKTFLKNALATWYGPGILSVWMAAKRPTAPIAIPNAGYEQWYITFNGQQQGPIITPDPIDVWLPTFPSTAGQCSVFRTDLPYRSDWFGGYDLPCTGALYYGLCEYRSKRRTYRQVKQDQRAISSLVISNTTYSHRIECVHACRSNWVCSSLAYNEVTKDCYLQMTDSTVNATNALTYFESAPGYRMYEVEDSFEVVLS